MNCLLCDFNDKKFIKVFIPGEYFWECPSCKMEWKFSVEQQENRDNLEEEVIK